MKWSKHVLRPLIFQTYLDITSGLLGAVWVSAQNVINCIQCQISSRHCLIYLLYASFCRNILWTFNYIMIYGFFENTLCPQVGSLWRHGNAFYIVQHDGKFIYFNIFNMKISVIGVQSLLCAVSYPWFRQRLDACLFFYSLIILKSYGTVK